MDKRKTGIDWLVDDSPQNWHAWKKGRGTDEGFILMDAVYNQHLNATHRVKSIIEVIDIVDNKRVINDYGEDDWATPH